jgi:nucleotide-binding universal stress UspA family protein
MLIVLGVDDSEHAEVAARHAITYAAAMDAELHAVHALHISGTVVTALASVPDSVTDFAKAERESVWSRIDPILGDAEPVVHVDLDGYPPDAIAGYADEVGADLIVVGSRGRGGVASLILGSTSHRLIHIAKTDVLIAREGRAAA